MSRADAASTVVVTGAGLSSCLGDVELAREALAAGRTGVTLCELAEVAGLPPVPAAPAEEASPLEFLSDRKLMKYMSPAARMAVLAAGRALRDAHLLHDGERRAGLGLYLVTGLIAFEVSAVKSAMEASRAASGHLDLQRMGGEGFRLCHPLLPFKLLLNTPLGLVSIVFGIKGSNFILYPDGAQGGTCVEAAARAIRGGRLAGALVGGTSCGLSFLPLCTLRRLGRLASDPRSATPYRPGHAGYAPADAAAFVVLESLAAARARGARPRAVLEGVAAGRTPIRDRALRWRSHSATWSALCAGRQPEMLVTAGTVDHADDRAALEAVQAAWPGETLPVTSPDGGLGYTGAASFLVNLSLGARMAEEDRATPLHGEEASLLSDRWPAEAQNLARGTGGNRVLICTTDPDGGHAAAVLRRPED